MGPEQPNNHLTTSPARCAEVGPGIDFRKFLWKFDGLGDRRFPEIPLEIWDLGGKSWGGDLGVGQVRRADRVN